VIYFYRISDNAYELTYTSILNKPKFIAILFIIGN